MTISPFEATRRAHIESVLVDAIATRKGLRASTLREMLLAAMPGVDVPAAEVSVRLRALAVAGAVHSVCECREFLWYPGRKNAARPDGMHVVPPRRPDTMSGHYVPPKVAMRPGSMDYAALPSLDMGQRRDFRSEAAES